MTGNRSRARFVGALLAIAAIALALRVLFPAADPPWNPSVGIVWHDEGAWVHNARNRALFGAWSLDAWNPMYIAPVFTGLEYLSFAAFGVGVRQARLVSEIAGLLSVLLLAAGVRRVAGATAGIIAGALLATNYVYVMYNRAAIMEATMVAFMVAAWYCYVRAQERPLWGAAAAACALLAFFTKAAAAFFIAALGVEALIAILRPAETDRPAARQAGMTTLTGFAAAGVVALAAFVAPNWSEYRFYNWQMSVTRKPSYDIGSLVDRASWFPILHDTFTRMWLVLVVATCSALAALGRWRRVAGPERLLLLWIGLGALELLIHDVGNERRFVFFIPALIAAAAIVLGGRRYVVDSALAGLTRSRALLALPLVLFASYVLAGAIVRVSFLYQIQPGVRTAAALAVVLTGLLYATWPRVPRWLAGGGWSPRAALLLTALVCAGDLVQFAQWARGRTYKNYEASLALGQRLPPDTLVHGKLANGLALENRIRPVFVGRGFGNYEDRKRRDDVRYILTYVEPRVGYEGPVIREVLDAYPERRLLMTFEVAETTGGHDRAALFDKQAGPGQPDARAEDRTDRAHH
jgi:4-amino-4-deoxy-L-arabinose transferase-like glycosyltransferase